ncbi:MAG TPA: hypothetical protein VLB02_03170, partial [Candidatus Paceibacterota bacterium]|nr:hypothetical protein [Candidatus Paceibacterota bacterium]
MDCVILSLHMKRFVLVLFFLLLIAPLGAFAQTGIPASSFWYTPTSFKAGDTVTFTVLVYNGEPYETAFTVLLQDGTKKIEEQQVILAKNTAMPVRFSWKAADGAHAFTATIASARSNGKVLTVASAQKNAVLQTGAAATSTEGKITEIQGVVKSKAGTILAAIDSWRVKKLAVFTARKAALKSTIDSTDATEKLNSIADSTTSEQEDIVPTQKAFLPNISPLVYLEFFWYTVLVFVFSSALIFYITTGLAAFLVLKFLYARFV